MSKVINYFINNTFVVNLVAGFVCIVGLVSLFSMNRDLHPPFEFNEVTVKVVLLGATPQEMEKYVTYPIEEALKGLRGLEKIESTSGSGQSNVTLNFHSSYNLMSETPEIVRSKIDSIRTQLPDGIRSIQVTRSRTNDIFLYWLAVENFDEQDLTHRAYILNVERELLNIPGVANVQRWDRARNLYVEFYLDKLKKYEISATEIRKVLGESLNFTPVGEIRILQNKFSIELSKIADDIEKIKRLPISGNRSGHVVELQDVAKVHFKLDEGSSVTFVNGKKAISLAVRKDLTSDTINLKHLVQEKLISFNAKAPSGVKIISLVDGPQFVEKQMDTLKKNAIMGCLVVLIILMIFLNWRTALMTALGIPVSYLGTLIVLHALGMNFDLITLIGLILVVGILVDDAIIVSERYVELLGMGVDRHEAALRAVKDLIIPVTGTILTTVVAFSPLILIESSLSTVLIAVPIVVITSLIISWIESFFILPNHLKHFVKKAKPSDESLFSKVKSGYEKLLVLSLKYRYLGLVIFLALLGGSGYIAATKLKHDFTLSINPERLSIYVTLKESKSIEDTLNKIKPIEDHIMKLPKDKIENFYTNVGWVWMNGKVHEGFRYAKIEAYLYSSEKYPRILKAEMKAQLEEVLDKLKTDDFEKLYLEIEKGENSDEKLNMVSVRVRGADEADYIEIEKDIIKATQEVPSIKEFVADPDLYQETWQFKPDPEKLVQYGLSAASVARNIRGFFTPDELAQVRMGGESIRVYTEIYKEDKPKYEELNRIEVMTPMGVGVRLALLGQWIEKASLKKIIHYNGQRNLTLDFKIDETQGNVNTANEGLVKSLVSVQKKYPSYNIEVIDSNEEEAKNKAWAMKVAGVCIFGVLFVIALILGSLVQPFMVGMPILFGLIGIFFSLFLHNLPLGLMALIGLVGTVGVSVNSSIVMADSINKLFKENNFGNFNRELLIEGASSRLRAIFITTLTTLGGVFPMAYSLGGESGFTQPLAFSMGWGLLSSTILTLFLLPAFLMIQNDFEKIFLKIKLKVVKPKKSNLESKEEIAWQLDKDIEISNKDNSNKIRKESPRAQLDL